MFKQATARCAAMAILLGVGGVALAAQEAPSTADQPLTYTGITKPSEQRGLNFNGPGVVAQVLVKEGDLVKKGQLLAKQDDRADQADLKTLEAKLASSDVEINADQAQADEKKVEWDQKVKGFKKNVFSDLDVRQAELEYTIAIARKDMATKDKEEKQTEVDAQNVKLQLRELRATTDGIVQQINIHEGELASNDPKAPVMSIVTNQPLYVEVYMPATVAKSFKPGQKLQVRYTDEHTDKWTNAEIVLLNPVANATTATSSQSVRLQLENTEGMRAGMHVLVKLPEVASAEASR